eukprot:jgi/Mesvir1/4407/Mv26193-RA.2
MMRGVRYGVRHLAFGLRHPCGPNLRRLRAFACSALSPLSSEPGTSVPGADNRIPGSRTTGSGFASCPGPNSGAGVAPAPGLSPPPTAALPTVPCASALSPLSSEPGTSVPGADNRIPGSRTSGSGFASCPGPNSGAGVAPAPGLSPPPTAALLTAPCARDAPRDIGGDCDLAKNMPTGPWESWVAARAAIQSWADHGEHGAFALCARYVAQSRTERREFWCDGCGVANHQGKKQTTSKKTNCEWRVVIAKRKDGMFYVTKYPLPVTSLKPGHLPTGHNHELRRPGTIAALLDPMLRKLPDEVKARILLCRKSGVDLPTILTMIDKEFGENRTWIDSDVRNFLRRSPEDNLSSASKLVSWCYAQQDADPRFYWKHAVDGNNRLNLLFYATGDMRERYAMACDSQAVSVDATHGTNNHGMKLIFFTGVSPYGKNDIYGVALTVSEHEQAFGWIWDQFAECMHGHLPKVAITDEDQAMALAITKRGITHHLCIFHLFIMNVTKNMRRCFGDEAAWEKFYLALWRLRNQTDLRSREHFDRDFLQVLLLLPQKYWGPKCRTLAHWSNLPYLQAGHVPRHPRMLNAHVEKDDMLRLGRLTASLLAAVLGMFESDVAGHFGFKCGHARVIEALRHLRRESASCTEDLITRVRLCYGIMHESTAKSDFLDSFPDATMTSCPTAVSQDDSRFAATTDGLVQGWVSLADKTCTYDDGVLLEVKTHPTFMEGPTLRAGEERQCTIVWKDAHPLEKMRLYHFAQLQWQMKVKNMRCGLLLSWTMENGMRVFEVRRSDEWLSLATDIANIFWDEYVTYKQSPVENFQNRFPGYTSFIDLTQQLCEVVNSVFVPSCRAKIAEDARFVAAGSDGYNQVFDLLYPPAKCERSHMDKLYDTARKWARRFTWGDSTFGMSSSQRSEVTHNAIKNRVDKTTQLEELPVVLADLWQRRAESHEIELYRRSKHHLNRISPIAHPVLVDAETKLAKYAFDKLKIQLAMAFHYIVGPVYDGNLVEVKLSPESSGSQARREQLKEDEPTVVSRIVTLGSDKHPIACSCQYVVHMGLPCRHVLAVELIAVWLQAKALPLQCVHQKWLLPLDQANMRNESFKAMTRPQHPTPHLVVDPTTPSNVEVTPNYANLIALSRRLVQLAVESRKEVEIMQHIERGIEMCVSDNPGLPATTPGPAQPMIAQHPLPVNAQATSAPTQQPLLCGNPPIAKPRGRPKVHGAQSRRHRSACEPDRAASRKGKQPRSATAQCEEGPISKKPFFRGSHPTS